MRSRLKVDVVGTVGVPANYGGFETLVENLLEHTGPDNLEFLVYCSSKRFSEKLDTHKGAFLKYLPLDANGVSSIPYDILAILRSSFSKADVILILGVSGAPAIPIARILGKKIVVNIDGLEWRREKWGLLAAQCLKFFERIAVITANEVVVDNIEIQKYVSEKYNRNSNLIAYGGDHAIKPQNLAVKTPINIPKHPYAVKICRIEPENNVHIVLNAFAKNAKLNLLIIGNWGNSSYGRELRSKYSDIENITLLEPIYDIDLLHHYRSKATLYVHGHSAGGTNPSLVEAMCFGLPVLAYACGYNEATTENEAMYFNDESEIINAINSTSIKQFSSIGDNMFRIASERYMWSSIVNQYKTLLETPLK